MSHQLKDTQHGPSVARAVAAGWLVFGVAVLAALTLAGYAGRLHWTLELTSHFRLQYAVAAACLAALLAWAKGRWWAGGAAALSLINFGAVAPLYLGEAPASASGEPSLRVLAFNVHTDNPRVEAVARYIVETEARLTFIFEVSEEMHRALESLPAPFDLVVSKPRYDNFGIAMVARGPAEGRLVTMAPGISFIEASLEHQGTRWSLLAVHPVPPVSSAYARDRNRAFSNMAAWAKRQTGAHAIVGDFNVTPFSPEMWKLLEEGNLQSSQLGYGYEATYPRGVPWLWPMQIPIDHALVGGGVGVADRRIGPSLGSDHAALLLELTP